MEGNALRDLRADLHSLSKVASGLRFTNVQSQQRICRPRLSSSSSSLSDDQETGGIGISNDDAGTTTTPPCDSDNDDNANEEALPSVPSFSQDDEAYISIINDDDEALALTLTTPHCDNDDDVNEEAPPFEDYDEANEEALFSSCFEDDYDVHKEVICISSSEDDEDEMDNKGVVEDDVDSEAADIPGPRNTRTSSSSSDESDGSEVQILHTSTAIPSSTNKNRRRKTFKTRTKKVFLLPSSSDDSSVEEEEDINFYEAFAVTKEAAQGHSDVEGHEQRVTPTNYNIRKLNGKKKIFRAGTSRPYLLPSSSSSSEEYSPKPEENVTKKFIQFGVLPKNNNVNINSHAAVKDELSTLNNSDSLESLLQESEQFKEGGTKGTKKRVSVFKAIYNSDSSSSESDESDSESDFSSPSEDESKEIRSDEVIEKPRKGKRSNNKNKQGQRDDYLCPTCYMTFQTWRSYIHHRRRELGTSGFICEEVGCGKTFPNHIDLKVHKKYTHSNASQDEQKYGTEFRCNVCTRVFRDGLKLERHAAVHGIGKYFCKPCDKVFNVESDFKSHLKMHDKETYTSVKSKNKGGSSNNKNKKGQRNGCNYRCPSCDKTFKTRRSYIYHRQKELGTSGFNCEEVGCGKRFWYHTALLAHKKKAHPSSVRVKYKKGTVFRCKICNKVFYKKWKLEQHAAVHGIGKYSCKHCGKVFSIESVLKKHLKTHVKKT